MKNKRFKFGKNWQRFLRVLTDERICEAEKSLREMLGMERLDDKLFLDIGSGSGLFSLAARRLGATVYSFDYDEQSVECTRELKRRYFNNDSEWHIERGDVLDADYMNQLPQADIVYSWGVLHHTGNMWQAMEHAVERVKDGGLFMVALYNDQGWKSDVWRFLKRLYCSSLAGRVMVTVSGSAYFMAICLKEDLSAGRHPLKRYKEYQSHRGMSIWHDWLDWFGGYPFETATRDEVEQWAQSKGFSLKQRNSAGTSLGCNEWVFERISD